MYMTALTNDQINAYNAAGGSTAANTDPAAAQERFLNLFVAQLQNQDPLNPMDNAQMTSQMAQINTVTGIQQLNETLKGMGTQFAALQAMQGASLVGREVLVAGNRLSFDDAGVGHGAFSLASSADSVTVDVMGKAGNLLGTLRLGAQAAGQQFFDWNDNGIDPATVGTFRVTATSGQNAVTVTTLSPQRVEAVGMSDGAMTLRTSAGQTVGYDQVQAFM